MCSNFSSTCNVFCFCSCMSRSDMHALGVVYDIVYIQNRKYKISKRFTEHEHSGFRKDLQSKCALYAAHCYTQAGNKECGRPDFKMFILWS